MRRYTLPLLGSLLLLGACMDQPTVPTAAWPEAPPASSLLGSGGSFAYVTNNASHTVSVINTSDNTVVGDPIPVGYSPAGVAITPDGARAYVANMGSNTVSVINTSDNTVVGDPIPVGNSPAGVAITPAQAPSAVYSFLGFSAPVENPNVLNVAKAGQTIPRKWRLLQDDQPVTDLSGVSVSVANHTCGLSETHSLEGESATGNSGLQNLGDGYYQFNWATPKSYANSCKQLTLTLPGITLDPAPQALFKFNR